MNDHTPADRPKTPRSQWWERYDRIAYHAERLGRLPRLSDGVEARDVRWPAAQRRATRLTSAQRAALAALPGWSDNPRADTWEERADELRRFITTHHRAPRVRGDLPGESALAHWLSRQVVAAADGALDADRLRALRYVTRGL